MQLQDQFALTQKGKLMNKAVPQQSPRQRVWLAIRKFKNDFTLLQVAEEGAMKETSTRDFITGLQRAGYIEVAYEQAIRMCDNLSKVLHKELPESEIGYLALHLERILSSTIIS